jgi:hypothetical protein
MGADSSARGLSFRRRVRNIYFAVTKLMTKKAYIAGAEAEAFGNNRGGLALDKRRAKGFISSLPGSEGPGEIGSISHG